MSAARVITFSILLVVVKLEVTAQVNTEFSKNLSVSFGTTHYRFIDEAFTHHRTQFNGTVFSMDLRYQKYTSKYSLNVELLASRGGISAKNQRLEGNVSYIQLATSYARHVSNYNLKGIPSAIYIGGQIRSSNYIIEDLHVLEEATVAFNQVLDLFLLQRMSLSQKNYLEITAAFPLAGFIKRTRYDGGANQDLEGSYQDDVLGLIFSGSKFSVLNPFRMPQLNMVYVHRLTRKTDFNLRYQFHYLKYNANHEVNLFGNGLVAGLRFNF